MSGKKKQIIKAQLLNKPSDFEYDEAKSLLEKFGYWEENKGRTSGSRVAFVNNETKHIIRFHKPHPGKLLKNYQIEQLIEDLRSQGVIE